MLLYQSAVLLLRTRRNGAGLVQRFEKFRRRNRLIREGVESLLHLADHGLPQHDRVVAFVGHRRPPASITGLVPRRLPSYDTVAAGRSTARRPFGRQRRRQKIFCVAGNRGIEFRSEYLFKETTGELV